MFWALITCVFPVSTIGVPTPFHALHAVFFSLSYFPHSFSYLSVIAFAGDALICAFRNTSEGISESCFRALQCAHVLRQHKTAYLSTHIGVTCGEMQIALLGTLFSVFLIFYVVTAVVMRMSRKFHFR